MAVKKFVGGLPQDTFGRILVYGPTGAGKSTFGATMPGPRAVIATENNAGLPLRRDYKALPRLFQPPGETNRMPAIFLSVETWADMQEAIAEVAKLAEAGKVRSVVFDSITAACEQVMREVFAARVASYEASKKTIPEAMDQLGYNVLKQRLTELRYAIHRIPAHVCWLAGHTPPRYKRVGEFEGLETEGGPDLPNQAAKLIPTACSAVLRVEKVEVAGRDAIFRVHTTLKDNWAAKDNVGVLSPTEPPEAMLILAKMGFLAESEVEDVFKALPAKTEAEKKNEALGILD